MQNAGIFRVFKNRELQIREIQGRELQGLPVLIKNSPSYSDLVEILATFPIHGLIILSKFDEDWTKIVYFLSLAYFLASIIFS